MTHQSTKPIRSPAIGQRIVSLRYETQVGIQKEVRPVIGGLRVVSVAVLLCVATLSAGLAQSIEIGANLGLTRTSFGGDGDLGSQTGFSIGVVFGYNLSRLLAVRPEIAFVRKGAGYGTAYLAPYIDPITRNVIEERHEYSVDLDYLELQVPITVAVPTGRSGAVKPRFYAGPAVAFETGCETETVIHLDVYSGTTWERLASETNVLTADCGGAYRRVDFGVMFGAGVGVVVGGGAITADIRYNLGLMDIYEGTGTVRNRTLQVLVGYVYHLSR
ncbi:MAG: PorT family protein [Gemmatimonadota bacterium]|nr:MAG: PorT family protein [Gemmatimonadota bacterium]